MPFRAKLNGSVVVPEDVEDKRQVDCPTCGGVMYPRDGEEIARHFYHADRSHQENCASIDESEVHSRCKALAVSALRRQWGDRASDFGAEISVDVSFTPTDADRRIADALLKFESRNPVFGKGLIIEVQHKNHDKNIRETTYDYLSADFSVVWLEPSDFDGEKLDYNKVEEKFHSSGSRLYPVSLLPENAPDDLNEIFPDHIGYCPLEWIPGDNFGQDLLPDTLVHYNTYPHPKTNVSPAKWEKIQNKAESDLVYSAVLDFIRW